MELEIVPSPPVPPAIASVGLRLLVTEAPAWDDAADGWTDLRLAAQVTYRPASSSHQVCFTAPFPGPYVLSLHLLVTNACQMRTALNRVYNQGYQNYQAVALRKLQVSSHQPYDGSPDALSHLRNVQGEPPLVHACPAALVWQRGLLEGPAVAPPRVPPQNRRAGRCPALLPPQSTHSVHG
ncbi:unnamed protein product [Closterium sp. Yama58-4]|nr:unnamed protein product [Closterium sp. Yama58-4]